jgi:hypothetical protein
MWIAHSEPVYLPSGILRAKKTRRIEVAKPTCKSENLQKRTTSLEGTKGPSPYCPFFGGFTVAI